MKKAALTILAASLLLWALAGCSSQSSLAGAQMQVGVVTPLESAIYLNQEFRINVELADANKQPLANVKVVAEVFDADKTSLGSKFTCRPLAEKPGRYQSESFVPPQKAKAGTWQVVVTAGQGTNTVSSSVLVQVDEPPSEQVKQYGIRLDVPPSWFYYSYQQSAQDPRVVRFNPLPAGSTEEALLEIRYDSGQGDVGQEAARQSLLSFRPADYKEGNSSVENVVPIKVQGHNGWLARGSFVTNLGQDQIDRNFAVEVLRFYCDKTDRTFTIIKASTSDAAMSEMSAVIDGFACHQ
jgi:hypothetical protein